MTIGNRIQSMRRSKGLTQDKMAQLLNVAPNTLSNWENDVHAPSRAKVRQIADILGVSPIDIEEQGVNPDQVIDASSDLGGLVFVPEYTTRVAADGGVVVEQEADKPLRWPWPKTFFETEIKANPRDCGVLEVIGDSMEPTLRSGDRVLVNFSRINPARPGIYVLSELGEAIVKRVELIPGSRPPRLRISSDNPLHQAYEVAADDVQILGWVELRVTRI